MRCACGLDPDFALGFFFGNPQQSLLVFMRREQFGVQVLATARRHQEKEIYGRRPDFFSQIQDLRKLMYVKFADCCIYLKVYVRLSGATDSGKTFFKCAGTAPESIVCRSIGSVQACSKP